jgi:membrane-bound lytic murein transglycosylase D
MFRANAAKPFIPAELPLLEALEFPTDEIKFRIQLMRSPVSPVYNDEVEAYLRRFLTYGKKDTEAMLGRAAILFPVFEHYLDLHGLPQQLKFLPIIESSLFSYAVSTKGAAGLWQLMPLTAQSYGLVIENYLDERRDPYKSTETAVKYLKRLYRRFGSWELALAAYNCGPTKVSRAVKARKSSDYWKIRGALPYETQAYVSRFLAASYVGTFYQLHDLTPTLPGPFEMQAMAAKIYRPVSLPYVSFITGVDIPTLRQLNPAFLSDFVPAQRQGVYLALPRSAWYAYLDAEHGKKVSPTTKP